MYFDDLQQHHTPHFHAKYGEFSAVFNLDGELIAGSFPRKQQSYIIVWADIHNKELVELWNLMQKEDKCFQIKGLE